MKRSIVLLAKTRSRRAQELFGKAREALEARGAEVVEAHLVADNKEMCKRMRQAIKRGHKHIAIAGGDGAMTTAVGALAHHEDVVLGVIPAGTGNSFALTLGIGEDFDRAIETIVSGEIADIDLGIVNGIHFANFAAIGLAADIGKSTPRGLKAKLGAIAYGVAGVKPILTHEPFRCKVKWGKKRLQFQTHQVLVASGRYYGHQPLLPDASPTDGKLAFYAKSDDGRFDLMKMYFALIRGEQTDMEDAHYFKTKKVKITAKPRQSVMIDGKSIGKTPATFTIERKALRVFVPRGEDLAKA